MRRFHRIASMAVLISFLFHFAGYSQKLDYKEIFADHYQAAESFLITNQWIADSLINRGIDACTGLAIVFPELIRYSSLRDKIETTALQSLYIQYGKKYADFSIGHFQMKPSFAEDVEKEYSKWKGKLLAGIDTTDCAASRKERIKKLCSTEGQVIYLRTFMLLMGRALQNADFSGKIEEVRYLAAAFNHGFKSDPDTLKSISQKRFFYLGLVPPATKYNYTDIAAEFYLKYCGKYGNDLQPGYEKGCQKNE